MLESAVERRAGTTRHERRWPTSDLSSQLCGPAPHSAVPHRGGTKLISSAINKVLFEADGNTADRG
jgi:hypothetical protein